MHVHMSCPDGEAKFWLEPVVALADFTGLSKPQLTEMHQLVEAHRDEVAAAWQKHFGSPSRSRG